MRTRKPGQSALLLLDAVTILAREGVDYAVIGAMAASVYGVIRASLDADALLSVTTARLKKLELTFERAGFHTELRRGDADDPIPALLALSDAHGNRVDLLGGLRGLDPEAFSRANEVSFHGETLRIISREDFLAMKCFAGAPQDIADARQLLMVSREGLDLELLKRVTRRYGRKAVQTLEKVLDSAAE